MTLIEQIKEVMAEHKGGAHINDIANMLIAAFPHIKDPQKTLKRKIAQRLGADVRKKGAKASFARVAGKKKGSFRKGMYRLKKRPLIKPKLPEQPTVSNLYTGKAGEIAVVSELLFNGFNASLMSVDDGIDVIASKNNKYFHIQVKTANSSESGIFGFSIKKSSFDSNHSFQMFYIFVFRCCDNTRYFNDYLILPSSQIKNWAGIGIINNEGPVYSLRVTIDKSGKYNLNNKQDVTLLVNNFNQIA